MDKLVLICAFFITVVCIVRCCLSSKKSLSDIFLNLSLFALVIITIVYYLGITSKLIQFPHFYRLGTLATFIYMPASFLFVKYTLEKSNFKFKDLILFLPALVFLADFMPFFMQNADAKLAALQYDLQNESAYLHIQSRWMPHGTYYIVQNCLGVMLGGLQLYRIANLLKLGGKAFYIDNKHIIQWFSVWSFLLIASCLPDLLNGTLGYTITIKDYIYITPCLLLYFLYPLSILLNPRLLYGSKGFWISKDQPSKFKQFLNHLSVSQQQLQIDAHINDIMGHSLQLLKESGHANSATFLDIPNNKKYFAEAQANQLKFTLDKIITDNKIYLMKQLSVKDLANAMSVNPHHLDDFINHYIGLTFIDYINSYKVKAFIDHYYQSETKNLKVSANASGFDTENELLGAFKKITGTWPDQFIAH